MYPFETEVPGPYKLGTYHSYNGLDGFKSSEAGVMIIHSKDDEMVSFENQFNQFYGVYGDDPRFTFVEYEDKGHDYIYYSELSKDYREAFDIQFTKYIDSLDTDFSAEIKTNYMNEP